MAVVARDLRRDLEVQDVAGVVLDDLHDTRTGVGVGGPGGDLQGGGAGEHRARNRDGQHPRADEADVQRLVARPAAADQPDRHGRERAPRHERRVVVQLDRVRMGQGEASEGLGDQVVGIVDELAPGHEARSTRPHAGRTTVAGADRVPGHPDSPGTAPDSPRTARRPGTLSGAGPSWSSWCGGGGNRTPVLRRFTKASPGAVCCDFLGPSGDAHNPVSQAQPLWVVPSDPAAGSDGESPS